jgi:hypothetical protein
MPEITNFDELYPGRFLKAGLFKCYKPTLTIKNVRLEELVGEDGQPKQKAILSFVERPMEHVMPKTNAICLKAMFGKDLTLWRGKRITLFAGQWNGEECIRVWGSPDITEEMVVKVELPRRKAFNMTMHVTKPAVANGKKPVGATPDPRILAGWEVMGWSREKGEADRANKALEDSKYLAHLNALLDEVNTNEMAGEMVP